MYINNDLFLNTAIKFNESEIYIYKDNCNKNINIKSIWGSHFGITI